METDPRGKIVRGICDKSVDEIFDSWIHDGRRGGAYGTSNHIDIASQMRFFCGGAKDPRRCNHVTSCMFGGDETYRVTHVGLHISFSDPELETDFIRGAVVKLSVGDRPCHYLNAQLLAQPEPFVRRLKDPDPAKSGLLLWVDLEKAQIAIPPRQPFWVDIELQPSVRESLHALPKQRSAFAMIKVMLQGLRTRAVFEDELSDEDRERFAAQHEELMRQQQAEQDAALERHEALERQLSEEYAFFLNAACPDGEDIKPEHVETALKHQRAIDEAIYRIGGGGHRGGVPPFARLEWGEIEELEVGKAERGFPIDASKAFCDQDALSEAARRIAKARVADGQPLDEDYFKAVAAEVGIDDYHSAVPEDYFKP